ncbi:hypothetical protein HMPREF9080_00107 [Cardiobacterium valvarum F0432]|uniref:Uncharacterized protein n=1 Tax=Cardiobacterium valvarum F0432 TaxID=797473 RepID=G9ZBI4_9GAMM|nr:hypothetical protein HMPREF9080_00107 [Cardiobacterium valvarum F0432]
MPDSSSGVVTGLVPATVPPLRAQKRQTRGLPFRDYHKCGVTDG